MVKRAIRDWFKVLVLLLDEAAAVVLVFVVLRFFKVEISLPVAITVALPLGAVIFITHKAVIPSFRLKVASGSEAMIGAQGRVVKPLAPVGTVTVRGERWKAKSVDGNIGLDEDVEIVSMDGLTLKVKRKAGN